MLETFASPLGVGILEGRRSRPDLPRFKIAIKVKPGRPTEVARTKIGLGILQGALVILGFNQVLY